MTDHTVVGDRVALNVGFRAARTRLKILAEGGMLLRASEVAYGEGITALVELTGPAAGLTRLADVCMEDLTQTVWAATKLATHAGGWRQINRAGHPMMWPIFWPNDTDFTNPANTRHPAEDVSAASRPAAGSET